MRGVEIAAAVILGLPALATVLLLLCAEDMDRGCMKGLMFVQLIGGMDSFLISSYLIHYYLKGVLCTLVFFTV